MHGAFDVPSKRKRGSEREENLDDEDTYDEDTYDEDTYDEDTYDEDIYDENTDDEDSSKASESKSGSLAQSSPESFGKVNTGLGTQPPRKKPRRAGPSPGKSQEPAERFPGSTWFMSEANTLYRLLQEQRDLEKKGKLAPLRDAKLWKVLSAKLNAATGGNRTDNACKNFWNRYGRKHYDCEERGDTKRSDSKVTSAQSSKKEQQPKQETEIRNKAKTATKKGKKEQDEHQAGGNAIYRGRGKR